MQDYLTEKRLDYISDGIWRSEVRVIDRLLRRDLEMKPVYQAITSTLNRHRACRFLDIAINTAAIWSPKAIAESRAAAKELEMLNREIYELSRSLSEAIERRKKLSETSGISGYEDYHPLDWIELAAKSNPLFELYLQDKLRRLRGQYDLKYWPSMEDVAWAIGQFAEHNEIEADNPLTKAAISSRKSSKADFLRALDAAIKDASTGIPADLPRGYRLPDDAMASIVNCLLGHEGDEMISAEYVKRFRQREREAKKRVVDVV